MSNHPSQPEHSNDAVNQFLVESKNHLEDINRLLLAFEQDPEDASILDRLFKTAHALNGTAIWVNQAQLIELSRVFGRAIASLRSLGTDLNKDLLSTFFKANDLMNVLVEQVEKNQPDAVPIEAVVTQLEALALSSQDTPAPPASEHPPVDPGNVATEAIPDAQKADEHPAKQLEPIAQQDASTSEDTAPTSPPTPEPIVPAIPEPAESTDSGAPETAAPTTTELPEAPDPAPSIPSHTPTIEEVPEQVAEPTPDPMPEPSSPSPTEAPAYEPSSLMIQEANKQLVDPDMDIVVDAFLSESYEFFDEIEDELSAIGSLSDKSASYTKICEQIGIIRSTSGFLSLEQIALLSRKIELLFEELQSGKQAWSVDFEELLFPAFSLLHNLIIQVIGRSISPTDARATLIALDHAIAGTLTAESLANLPKTIDSFVLRPAASSDTSSAETTDPAPKAEAETTFNVGADHPLYSEGMKEIVESFIVETGELFDELDNKLLELEDNYQNTALVDEIFRAVHTIKGSAGFLSLDQLNQLAHHFEDVLNRLRRGDLSFHSDMMDVMFEAFDLMKILQKQVIDMELKIVNSGPIIAQLKAISEGKFTEGAPAAKASASTPGASQTAESNKATSDASKKPKVAPKRTPDRSTETIRVEVERLDSLMNLVGELVLNRNRLVQIIDDVSHVLQDHDELYRILLDTSSQLDFITSELQTGVMHTRMVQVGRVFNKFPRVVRDLAKDADKKINLVIEGAETELDKSLTEEIGDPLVHLIRNSVDHGIESPEQRMAQGKEPEGLIRLSAQHEGNNIVIEIEDNGKGIDPNKLKKKAIEKGLISEKEASEMSDKDAFNLIFKAGFSTAETVTKISGRGVGMDVVKTNIAKMNGTIGINSELGVGTVITLKLPLTLAINQSLLVRQGDETFAIPLHSVIEVVSLDDQKIESINGHEAIRIRERILPLVRIGNVLNIPGSKPPENAYAVVVGLAHHRIGLVTDDLIGQKEIVIKPLGNYLKKVEGIAGSTILGDGHVIMILDVAQLIRADKERAFSQASEPEYA